MHFALYFESFFKSASSFLIDNSVIIIFGTCHKQTLYVLSHDRFIKNNANKIAVATSNKVFCILIKSWPNQKV